MTERGRRALFWSTLISLLVFQTHSAFAQSQAVTWATARQQALSEARDLLRSSEASDVAWGAFRAAEYRLTDLLPDVVARLEASPESSGDESYALRSALVDSAVQLSAAVPAPVLRTYWKDFPVQSAILFAKTTGPRDDVLLDLLSSSTDLRWFALANLLVQSRPDGFIQKVLAPLHLQLDVTVSEEGRAGSGGSGGGGVGDGVGQSPPGFPPRATYRFESASWPGHVVLSTGPRLVYYSRSVSYAFQFGVSEAFIGGPTGAERLTYAHACAFPAEGGFPVTTFAGLASVTRAHPGKERTRCDVASRIFAPTCFRRIERSLRDL